MADKDGASDTDNATGPDVEANAPDTANVPEALVKIINILQPLSSGARHRTVSAAMVFLGEVTKPTMDASRKPESAASSEDDREYTEATRRWMWQHTVSTQELERVFHFTGSEFAIHDVPGRSKREQAINMYILTGLGTYLSSNGGREFADATARSFCETLGILDLTNHAKYLKERHPEFTGDKNKGYTLTNPGLKRGAELVNGLAGSNSD